jgi:outer membrane autotransporter protein
MKSRLAFTLILTLATSGLSAAEVYFDTVNTAKATRLQGAYVGTFVGAANVTGTSTSRRLSGLGVEGDRVGWLGGVEFGYKWATPIGVNLAAELEFYYLNQDISGTSGGSKYRSSLSAFGAMANGIVQLDMESILGEDAGWVGRIKPYLGAGVGYGYGSQDDIAYKRNGERERSNLSDGGESGFAYQLLAGVEVELADNFSVYGEYRYLDLYDFGNGDINGAEVSSWLVGVRFLY